MDAPASCTIDSGPIREVLATMAVCWRCPVCAQVSCEDDVNTLGQPVGCDHCAETFAPPDTLCVVCEAPNPWARRDSLHFICRECGTMQTYYSPLRPTG